MEFRNSTPTIDGVCIYSIGSISISTVTMTIGILLILVLLLLFFLVVVIVIIITITIYLNFLAYHNLFETKYLIVVVHHHMIYKKDFDEQMVQ